MTKINKTNRTDVGHLTNEEIDAVSGGMIGYHEEDPQNPKRPDRPRQPNGSKDALVIGVVMGIAALVHGTPPNPVPE